MLRLSIVFVIAVMLITVAASQDTYDETHLSNRGKPPTGNEDSVEELKDMLVVSMQNIVSLNDLVTQLTQKIVQIMLSVGETKEDIKLLKTSFLEEVATLRGQIKEGDYELKSQVDSMDTEHNSTMAALADDVRAVTENVDSIDAEVQEMREELSQMSKEVTIVSAEGELRDQKCAKVCAGTTGRTSTTWVNYGSNGIKTSIDISGCGFVSVPTVTTSLEGRTSHWGTTGSSEVYNVTTETFQIYINGGRAGTAPTYTWNVEWVAVGFTC